VALTRAELAKLSDALQEQRRASEALLGIARAGENCSPEVAAAAVRAHACTMRASAGYCALAGWRDLERNFLQQAEQANQVAALFDDCHAAQAVLLASAGAVAH
jgi:hypothetical protein